jgi:hypothetical protein
VLRRLVRPFWLTRTAVLVFAWQHRHEILRWGRTIWAELTRPGKIQPTRLALLGQILWVITSDESIARSKHLKAVRLDGDVLTLDTTRGWQGTPMLVARLGDVRGVSRIVDRSGRDLGTVIDVA